MSDTEKPGREDEHAHGHADHGHSDQGHAAPAHDDHGGQAAPSPGDHAVSHQDHPAAAVDHSHDDHAHADHGRDDHGHAGHAHAAAADPHPHAPEAPAAATVTSETHRPVWTAGDTLGDDDAGHDKPVREARSDKGAGGETFEIIKTIFFALLIALVLRVLFFQPFTIPSASMEPNLYEGDYIVVSKWSYGYSKHSIPFSPPVFEGRLLAQAPERGDIAVFKLPRDNKTDYIKRVIGLPGDRIQMVGNRLHINGQPVEDVVVSQGEIADLFGPRAVTRVRETLPGGATFQIQDFGPGGDLDDTAVYEVPVGHYFMMGDNRDNSIDSRVEQSSGVGLVPAENLIGKAEIIMFSWEPGASLFNPVSWFANVRPSRFFTVLH